MGGVTRCEEEVTQSVVASRLFFFLEKSAMLGSAERRATRKDRMTPAGGTTPTA